MPERRCFLLTVLEPVEKEYEVRGYSYVKPVDVSDQEYDFYYMEQDDEVSYIWENFYYEDQQINEYLMTIFRRQENSDLYERFEESHYQKAYDIEHLKKLLEKSGLEMVECLDASMDREPAEDSERVYVIARVPEA